MKHCPVTSFLPSSSTGSYHRIYLNSDDDIIQELEQLHKSFTDLASSIRKRIDKLIELGTPLRDIAIYIEEVQIYRVRCLTAVKTTDEFFELVRPHYNFLDCDLLETLADKFLDDEVVRTIQQHKRKVLNFKCSSQVDSLKNNLEELITISDYYKTHSMVVVMIQNTYGERPLILMELLINNLFKGYGHECKWFKVLPGSVCLMFVAHNDICHSLITLSCQKLEFMRLMGVFSLQIGSEYVLQEDENKSYTFELALLKSSKVDNNEAVRFLLYMGVNVNHSDTEGKTALILASKAGHRKVVKTLLSAGADGNYLNSGRIALMSASRNGHSEVVEILLKGNADSNIKDENGWTALMSGSRNGHSEVVEILLNGNTDPNIQDNTGWTALMCACQNGHSEVVKILLDGNADSNIQDEDGWTALMSACQNGHSEVVEILLQENADPNIMGDGWTALMSASRHGHPQVVEILLEKNADPNIQGYNGWIALMSANDNDHSDVADIIINWR